MISLPIQQALESGKSVLFIGSGIGFCALNSTGDPMPTARDLAIRIANRFAIKIDEADVNLAQIALIAQYRSSKQDVRAYIRTELTGFEPDDNIKWLLNRPWRGIFTTNYDSVIEKAYSQLVEPPQKPVVISRDRLITQVDSRFDVPIYHLHGYLEDPESELLLTEEDYALFREQRRMLFNILKTEFATSPFIYVGYSHGDTNWKTVFTELRSYFLPTKVPQSFRITPGSNAIEDEILLRQGVETIKLTLQDFVKQAHIDHIKSPGPLIKMEYEKEHVPVDLHDAFDASPIATVRLLQSWEYVNSAPFDQVPNTRAFLNGDRPNWGTVAGKHCFERDVEHDLYESILDYWTDTARRYDVVTLIAPAGYGTTTVLKSTAAKLAHEKLNPVLYLREGGIVNEGDILFACRYLKNRPIFIVDQASMHTRSIASALNLAKSQKLSYCFLCGDRKNEWRSNSIIRDADEYTIERLSEGEIDKLIHLLEAENALGVLEGLTIELRQAAIREKHDRQLLVTMREATEGALFSAIIENEYSHLASDLDREVYSIVSAVSQVRLPIRDMLLADMINSNVVELYQNTKHSLDGVVEFEEIDPFTRAQGARCRHQVIAQIIWERCVAPHIRDEIMCKLVDMANINYLQDKNYVERIIQSDSQIDSLSGLEAKIRFFDIACERHPDNPYVLQHYSRMLRREKHLVLALEIIDKAISLRKRVKVFHHTRGVILTDMTFASDNKDIAKKRLAQAESALREAMRLGPNDAYSYQSLAELYTIWAEKSVDEDERAIYISKAEEVIRDGLKNVNEREGLWIASAKVNRLLGDSPQVLANLSKARTSPVAMYLLARHYYSAGEIAKVIECLEPILKSDPNEFRSAVLLARAYAELRGDYRKGISVLRLSDLLGWRDPKYIATLGGMLMLAGESNDAADTFRKGSASRFTYSERNKINYRPNAPGQAGNRLTLQGKVLRHRFNRIYVLLENSETAHVKVPNPQLYQLGQSVSCEIGFSMSGLVIESAH
ncbi:MAG: SIR2 family protein [Planctomycetia bacterium]|nr:SIR2 family protein [Planctomycetia bacterium]